jgi:hypothetical protein
MGDSTQTPRDEPTAAEHATGGGRPGAASTQAMNSDERERILEAHESEKAGYAAFLKLADEAHAGIEKTVRSFENWLIAVAGGSTAIIVTSDNGMEFLQLTPVQWAVRLLLASIILALAAKGLAYIFYSHYVSALNKNAFSFSGFEERIAKEIRFGK